MRVFAMGAVVGVWALSACATAVTAPAPLAASKSSPAVTPPMSVTPFPGGAGSQATPIRISTPATPRPSQRLAATGASRPVTPLQTLVAANVAARRRPSPTEFTAARQVYQFAPGAIYELHTSPGFVSTILLEPGETLNDIAAGDTSRWMVTEAVAETERDGRSVVLVKPQAPGLKTNLVLITDRRTYVVEAISRTGDAYAAQIAWSYPADPAASVTSFPVDALRFDYRVTTVRGRTPRWRPTRVFDDGRRTWIEMPDDVASGDMAPLFVITAEGAELVNYRVLGARYMVDRVFDVAELRLGTRRPVVVRIERGGRGAPGVKSGARP